MRSGGGLIQTYSLSSFRLLIILPSEQDERGGSRGVRFFQRGAAFLLLRSQNTRGHGNMGKDRKKEVEHEKGDRHRWDGTK